MGVGLVIIGVLAQPPYPVTETGEITHATFIVGGLTLAALPWAGLRSRRWRATVSMFGAAACALRAATLLFSENVPGPWQTRVVGAVVWSLLGNSIAVMMVLTWPLVHRRLRED